MKYALIPLSLASICLLGSLSAHAQEGAEEKKPASASQRFMASALAGVSVPQFDSPRTVTPLGLAGEYRLSSDWGAGIWVQGSERNQGSFFGDSESYLIVSGVSATRYFEEWGGPFVSARVGGAFERSRTRFYNTGEEYHATSADLLLGPAGGYDYAFDPKASVGAEASVYALMAGRVSFLPSAFLSIKARF